MRIKSIDATRGSLVGSIFAYSIPLFLTTLLQQLFNAVDIAVLGNMADSSAVAAVGATGPITSLLVGIFVGFASATKIILARYIGADDEQNIKRTMDVAVILPLAIGAIMAVVGWFLSPYMLIWTGCPESCFSDAEIYLRLYVCSAPAILFYNFGSSVLTASGDTQRPLYYMMACGVLNVVLNVILCIFLPQKVMAVAIATAASQLLGGLLVFNRWIRMDGVCRLILSKIRWSTVGFVRVLHYGLPLMVSSMLYPISNLQIQSAINNISVSAIAGNSAASTIETLGASGINSAFATATTAFMGQNIGAKKHDRVKKSFFYCLIFSISISVVVSLSFYLAKDFFLSFILTNDTEAYSFAYLRMQCVLLFYGIASANGCLTHAIQAFGYPIYGTTVSIISVFGFRVVWMQFIYPIFAPSFFHLVFCFTLSWSLLLAFNIGGFIYFYRRYIKGKYKKI